MNILAQLEGIEWNAITNNILNEHGAVILLVVVVLVFVAITAFNINKRADKNEEFVLETAKEARENKDELIKVKDEFHAFQVLAATDKGVQLGRIDELSRLVKHNQDKYEEKEKIWNEERRQLKADIDSLSKELNIHREELNGKTAIIQALELERDNLQIALTDKDAQIARINTNLEATIKEKERLQDVVNEQVAQIVLLTQEIVKLEDAAKPSVTSATSKLDDTIKLPELEDTKELTPIEKDKDNG